MTGRSVTPAFDGSSIPGGERSGSILTERGGSRGEAERAVSANAGVSIGPAWAAVVLYPVGSRRWGLGRNGIEGTVTEGPMPSEKQVEPTRGWDLIRVWRRCSRLARGWDRREATRTHPREVSRNSTPHAPRHGHRVNSEEQAKDCCSESPSPKG